MLISINIHDKNKSTYVCDRCKVYISNLNRKAIFIAEGIEAPRKKWDLCQKCYKALERGINKK